MIQPKYNPEEALQRAKLMMGYDTRKTLKENKETLEEQTWWKSMLAGGATGAAVGAVAGPMAIPGAVVGAVLGLVFDFAGGDASKTKVVEIIKACSTNKKEIGKTILSDDELDELSDKLYTSMKGTGTEEDDIKDVFTQIQSVPDLCALVDNYKDNYGDLVEWLDGDLDGDEEWRDYVALPLRTAIRNSKKASEEGTGTTTIRQKNINAVWCSVNLKHIIELPENPYNGKKWEEFIIIEKVTQEELGVAKNSCPEKGGVVKTGGGGGYKPCSGTYSYGCKSDVIAKVQGCLGGLAQDGKFGPKTKAKLSAKGFTTFTDADVTKICEKTTVVEPEISGESPADIDPSTSTDF
jgi:hypothetical protein